MASESVKILIEAEDRASAQVEQTARAVEASVKGIKEVGAKAKASTEFVGVLAMTMGGTEIGGYASQLAAITEKVSQFSEVQKAGGAGALAFKLGLAGLVGVLGYQIGSALGNAIFQTEKYAEQLKNAAEANRQLIDATAKLSNANLADTIQEIELIRNPEEQIAEAKRVYEQFDKNILGTEAKLKASEKTAAKMRGQWNMTGEAKASLQMAEEQVEQDRAQLRLLVDQQRTIGEKFGWEAREVEAKKKANAEADAAEAKQKQVLQASIDKLKELRNQYDELTLGVDAARAARMKEAGLSDGDIAREQTLQRLVDAEKKKAEAEKQAQQEREANAKRVADLQKSEITRLEQQRIELTKGKEAAAAFALEQQGMDAATASRIAAEQARLEEAKNQMTQKGVEAAQPNTAMQSRLLTRGKNDDAQAQIKENTKVAAESLKTIAQLFQEQQKAAATKPERDAGIVLVQVKP
jgi:hypothetical protein